MREVSGWQSAAPATSPVFSGWIKPDRGRWGTSEKNSGATWRGDFQSPIPARPFRHAHSAVRPRAGRAVVAREVGGWSRGRDAGCPAPPAQIRACPLRHTAPTSGSDGRSRRPPYPTPACVTVIRLWVRSVLW